MSRLFTATADILPERPVRLDFEIRAGLPGAREEWEARAHWLGHVRTHAESLAALAVDRTKDEPEMHERAKLAAGRLQAMLYQGHAALIARASGRLDLATPTPELRPWPPAFAGEPIPPELESVMTWPLQWDDVHGLAAWARALAYYASGVQHGVPPAVRALASKRLQRLLDAAQKGLESSGGHDASQVSSATIERRKSGTAPGDSTRKRGRKKPR